MDVVVDKSKLFETIQINVEYIASRANYERISIISEDIDLFNRFFDESIATISATLDRFIERSCNSKDCITFCINAPYFDDSKLDKLNDIVFKTIMYDSVFKWLMMVYPDVATSFNENAKQSLIELTSLIYKRIL